MCCCIWSKNHTQHRTFSPPCSSAYAALNAPALALRGCQVKFLQWTENAAAPAVAGTRRHSASRSLVVKAPFSLSIALWQNLSTHTARFSAVKGTPNHAITPDARVQLRGWESCRARRCAACVPEDAAPCTATKMKRGCGIFWGQLYRSTGCLCAIVYLFQLVQLSHRLVDEVGVLLIPASTLCCTPLHYTISRDQKPGKNLEVSCVCSRHLPLCCAK